MDCGSPSTSRPPRARPSAAWPATIPAARARSATERCATTSSPSTRFWPTARRPHFAVNCDQRSAAASRRIGSRRATARSRSPRGGRDRRALSQGAATGRRLQSRRSGAGRDIEPINLAHLLVGSEGTLAFRPRSRSSFRRSPDAKVVGVCHFPTFRAAMEAAQHIVALEPDVGRTGRRDDDRARPRHRMFGRPLEAFVEASPTRSFSTEFADDPDENAAQHRTARRR